MNSEVKLGGFDAKKLFSDPSQSPISPDQIGILRMAIDAPAGVREYLAEIEKKIRQKLTEIQFIEKCHTALAYENGLLVAEFKSQSPPRSFKPWLRTFIQADRVDTVYRTLTSHENLYQAIKLLCEKEQVSAQDFISKYSDIAASIWYRLGSENYKNASLDELYSEFRRIREINDSVVNTGKVPSLNQQQKTDTALPQSQSTTQSVPSQPAANQDPEPLEDIADDQLIGDSGFAATVPIKSPQYAPVVTPKPAQASEQTSSHTTPSKLKTMSASDLLAMDKEALARCYLMLQDIYSKSVEKDKINIKLVRELKESLEIAEEEIADLRLEETRRIAEIKREHDLQVKNLTDALARLDPNAAAEFISVEEILATPIAEVLLLAENAPKEALLAIARVYDIPNESPASRDNLSFSRLKTIVITRLQQMITEQEQEYQEYEGTEDEPDNF